MNQGDIGHSWLVSYSYIYLSLSFFFWHRWDFSQSAQIAKILHVPSKQLLNPSVCRFFVTHSFKIWKDSEDRGVSLSVGISPVGLRTWLWGGVGGGNRRTERQISQPPSRHITSDVSSEKEEKGSMLQELRWKVGHPVLYNLTCLKDAAIFSCSLDQNLNCS